MHLFRRLLITIEKDLGDTRNHQCILYVLGENTVNGDHSDAHHSTFSQSSKEVCSNTFHIKVTARCTTCTICGEPDCRVNFSRVFILCAYTLI